MASNRVCGGGWTIYEVSSSKSGVSFLGKGSALTVDINFNTL